MGAAGRGLGCPIAVDRVGLRCPVAVLGPGGRESPEQSCGEEELQAEMKVELRNNGFGVSANPLPSSIVKRLMITLSDPVAVYLGLDLAAKTIRDNVTMTHATTLFGPQYD